MDFSNWTFWLIALPSLLLMGVLCGKFARGLWQELIGKWGLTILSLSLLGSVSMETLLIFLSVSLVAYVACRLFENSRQVVKKRLLIGLIPILLLPLLFYKYADFITSEILRQEWDTFRDLIIPIGISFYTFQIIAFCIDTLRDNQKVPSFIDYMNFCSFFPQIVAGPIERRDSLLPQMAAWRGTINSASIAEGVPYIILGIFYKCVMADNLALAMQVGYAGDNAFQVWTNNIAFGFRIYFDFAGYGLSAYGVAKCLGVQVTMNFMSPYTSCNVTEFWRRWHVSLTLWFRDYIYFAMGGSRTRFWWFNIIFMFLISGIWHGAGWNFIIWGGLAGVTMVIHRIFRKSKTTMPAFIGWMMTFGIMMFIWMFFYETDMNIVWKNFCTIADIACYQVGDYIEQLQSKPLSGAVFLVFLFLSLLVVAAEYISQKKYEHPYAIFLTPGMCALMVLCMCMLRSGQQSQFIYFAF